MSTDDAFTLSSGSEPSSAPSSPKNRVKFFCSHGGKILPRPADGQLKYVGGETRVIPVPTDITFQELMKKLTYLIDGEMILKYQVAAEDLDALVSVKSDEDLRHMFDEIDRYKSAGSPRLRAFLFPMNPIVMETQTCSLEQRYIDTINGIVRSPPYSIKQHPTISTTMHHGSFPSSACSSPRSNDSCIAEAINTEFNNYPNSGITVHKVPSSPSMYPHQVSPTYRRPGHYSGNQSPKRPMELSLRPERLTTVRSVGRTDGARFQVSPASQSYYYSPTSRQSRGGGCCTKCMHYDECSHYPDRTMDRTGGIAMSPIPTSPHGMRAWDGTMRAD